MMPMGFSPWNLLRNPLKRAGPTIFSKEQVFNSCFFFTNHLDLKVLYWCLSCSFKIYLKNYLKLKRFFQRACIDKTLKFTF